MTTHEVKHEIGLLRARYKMAKERKENAINECIKITNEARHELAIINAQAKVYNVDFYQEEVDAIVAELGVDLTKVAYPTR